MKNKGTELLKVAGQAGLTKSVISELLMVDPKLDETLWPDLVIPQILEMITASLQRLIDSETLPQSRNCLMAAGINYLIERSLKEGTDAELATILSDPGFTDPNWK